MSNPSSPSWRHVFAVAIGGIVGIGIAEAFRGNGDFFLRCYWFSAGVILMGWSARNHTLRGGHKSSLSNALSAFLGLFTTDEPTPVEYHYTKQAGGPWRLKSLDRAMSYGGIVPSKDDILLHKEGKEHFTFRITSVTPGGGNDAHFVRLEQMGHVDTVDLPPAESPDGPRLLS